MTNPSLFLVSLCRSLLSLSLLTTSLVSNAQSSELTLRPRYDTRRRALSFSISRVTGDPSCALTVRAGRSRGAVTTSPISLLAIAPTGTRVTRSVSSVALLRGRPPTTVIYSQAVEECGGVTRRSKVVPVAVTSSLRKGLRPDPWLLAVQDQFLRFTVKLIEPYPGVVVNQPTDLQSPQDGTNRIFVLDQSGKILLLPPPGSGGTVTTALDISALVLSGGERGLLGLAFHPDFSSNGFLYINYTKKPDGTTVIARYRMNQQSGIIDPSSALVLLEVEQPFSNHNGGALAFGPDGYLFIALGDGGSGGDPLGNAQNRTNLLGKILRIDVNSTSGGRQYSIPADNPYAGNANGFREEIFAYGLRNPWRISFDSVTGTLWAGDVGQSKLEEIDVIVSGGNYGWNVREGSQCYSGPGCASTGLIPPITEYTRSVGQSVTGGYVYHSDLIPALRRRYVYGDFGSGVVFAIDTSNNRVSKLLDSGLNISSFGVDSLGELYLLSYSDGRILKFAGA